MTTLFERVAGIDGVKIPIHGMLSCMREYAVGRLTAPDIITEFSLDAGQQTDVATWYSAINQGTFANKMRNVEKIKTWFYLAEIGIKPTLYHDEAQFNVMVAGLT